MCNGIKTELSCGHILVHLQRCHANRQLGYCKRSSSRLVYMEDTCAECDRSVHLRKAKMVYETDHHDLMRQYIDAKQTSDISSMRRLEREMMTRYRLLRDKNASICKHWGGLEVQWPSS